MAAIDPITPQFDRRPSEKNPRLVESRCNGCGLIVAASPARKFLSVAEQQHTCPVYLHEKKPPKSA